MTTTPRTAESQTSGPGTDLVSLHHRLVLLETQVRQLRSALRGEHALPRAGISSAELRNAIIDEDREVREVARLDVFRRENPRVWKLEEAARLESNRRRRTLNVKLRALDLDPVPLWPSLDARIEKLQRAGTWRTGETANSEPAIAGNVRKPNGHGARRSRRS